MRLVGVVLILLAGWSEPLCQVPPAKQKEIAEFKKRTKAEPYQDAGVAKVKVTVDEACINDGVGKNGRVEVEANTSLPGQQFVTVKVEGEEVARFWVRSLAKPLKLPPPVMQDPENASYSSSAQSTNGKSSCKIDMGGTMLYEGPGSDVSHRTSGKGTKQWYSVSVDGEVVYMVPIRSALVARAADESKKLDPKAEPQEPQESPRSLQLGEASISGVLARLNAYRKAAGVREVTEEASLSQGCLLHAQYLSKNPDVENGDCHKEEVSREGYSALGSKSAPRSVIGYAQNVSRAQDAQRAVDNLMCTLYHRVNLLCPQLKVVGVGCAQYEKDGLVLVMDVATLQWDTKVEVRPVLYPGDGLVDVPLSFDAVEWPDPIPEKGAKAGYPITAIWDAAGWKPGEARATLRCEEEVVECWLSTPERPARNDKAQPGVVCLIPKSPLKPNTKYTVELKCKQFGIEKAPDWSKTWSFTTQMTKK